MRVFSFRREASHLSAFQHMYVLVGFFSIAGVSVSRRVVMVFKDWRGEEWSCDGDVGEGIGFRLRRSRIVSVRISFLRGSKFTLTALETHRSYNFLLNLRGLVEISNPSRCTILMMEVSCGYLCNLKSHIDILILPSSIQIFNRWIFEIRGL